MALNSLKFVKNGTFDRVVGCWIVWKVRLKSDDLQSWDSDKTELLIFKNVACTIATIGVQKDWILSINDVLCCY